MHDAAKRWVRERKAVPGEDSSGRPCFTGESRSFSFFAYELSRCSIHSTSILAMHLYPNGSGTYVPDTIGWARFDSEIKPIIARHKEVWYCFHGCPGREAPGSMPDIKTWATK